MSTTAFCNTTIVTNGITITGKAVIIADGKIQSIIPETELPADVKATDLKGAYLAPGLIDLQIYGSAGFLFGGVPTVEALHQMELSLLQQGCTGFMATVATNSPAIVVQAIEAAKAYRKHSIGTFLGLHLEGPYLNPVRRGAHPEEFIKKATLTEVQEWIELGQGEVKMMTIAPELQDQEVVNYLHQQNIILSAGHTNATYEQAKSFLNKPIPAVTHLYNAMTPIHHRNPGIIPAIFEEKPYTSVVADGIHVNFAMINLAKRMLGSRLFLITDAVTHANQGIYPHRLNNDHYVMPNGTLSGSALSMLKAVQNCVQQADIDLPEAVNMASLYPAQLVALSTKGKVEAGYDADLVIFDADFNLQATYYKDKHYSQKPIN